MQADGILDVYGTDAAVQCPNCPKVFLVSRVINKKNGRRCPACDGSIARFDEAGPSVQKQ
jgi:NAD-dependent SIR2 family protein deacetylase